MALRHNQLLCHAVQIVALTYELLASDRQARRGRIHTLRGSIETPVFMPVGTRGAVIHLDQRDYSELDIEVVLGNTYHLMLRPGAETIDALGGLHAFTSWDGHMLTDSGGFQVMSLSDNVRVDDNGVTFTSIYDGDKLRFTPEDAVATQELLGADIQMVLDVCPALPAPENEVILAMERTHDWARERKSLTAEATRRYSESSKEEETPCCEAEVRKFLPPSTSTATELGDSQSERLIAR